MITPGAPRLSTRRKLWFSNIAIILVVLLTLMGQPASAAQAAPPDLPVLQQSVPRFEQGPCNFDVQTTLRPGVDYQCGTLIVPEQYEKPNGPTIQLGVAIFKSHDPNPQPDPLVMLQGGPGGSTIDTYLQLLSVDQRLRSMNRDIILFDQRGTEFSKPSLFCQQYYDESIRQLNEDLSTEESNRRAQAALKACHDQFVSQGIDLSAYNSLENAADVDALSHALGYSKINLYGVSYGTLLALHVMKLYPQDLRSVTIDSVVPPQINFITDSAQSENRALEEVFTTCEQQPDCNAAYPNLKQVFYNLVDQLNAHKVHIQVTDPKSGKVYPALFDGDSLIFTIVQMLYLTDFVPLIPRVIYNVRAGDYTFIEQVLSLVTFDKSINLGMYYSVLCSEDADFKPQDYNLNNLPKELAAAEKNSAQQFLQTCGFWNIQPLPASVDQPVSSSIPTLVLSGEFDPVTPPAYAQAAAKTLSDSYFFLFPVGGHGEVTSGECQDKIFQEFLNNPNQNPDGSCLASQKMVFSTPGSLVRLPVLVNLMNLRGLSGVELVIYFLALLFLLTALLVYPIAWLVRLFRRPARPAVPPSPYSGIEGSAATPVAPTPVAPAPARRGLYRLGPWLAGLAGLLLLFFIIVVAVIAFQMALSNDTRVLLGLPGSARPLFILPWIVGVLAVLMVVVATLAWARRYGSPWGRLYFTLLTISTWVCIAILGVWGMLTALFAS